MKYKDNWEDTKKRFEAWWKHKNIDRPLMRVVAKRKQPLDGAVPLPPAASPEEKHLSVERKTRYMEYYCKSHLFLADSYPNLDMDLGPGSLAAYLGSKPVISLKTIWFEECMDDVSQLENIEFDENNYWFDLHLKNLTKVKELSKGDYLVNIPDIVENVDILSAIRGAQNFCFDLIDEPDLVKSALDKLDKIYFKCYDKFYNALKNEDGSSSYTVFNIWGPGKTAKIQCDFSAMMSPDQFIEFVVPSLTYQSERLDNVLYHLDGPDAIRHLDALMQIKTIDALQWTPGAGQPDGGSEKWYGIYDKVVEANKSLWITIYDGEVDQWIESADRLVKRYGPEKLYLLFPVMEEEDAYKIINTAEKQWVK